MSIHPQINPIEIGFEGSPNRAKFLLGCFLDADGGFEDIREELFEMIDGFLSRVGVVLDVTYSDEDYSFDGRLSREDMLVNCYLNDISYIEDFVRKVKNRFLMELEERGFKEKYPVLYNQWLVRLNAVCHGVIPEALLDAVCKDKNSIACGMFFSFEEVELIYLSDGYLHSGLKVSTLFHEYLHVVSGRTDDRVGVARFFDNFILNEALTEYLALWMDDDLGRQGKKFTDLRLHDCDGVKLQNSPGSDYYVYIRFTMALVKLFDLISEKKGLEFKLADLLFAGYFEDDAELVFKELKNAFADVFSECPDFFDNLSKWLDRVGDADDLDEALGVIIEKTRKLESIHNFVNDSTVELGSVDWNLFDDN